MSEDSGGHEAPTRRDYMKYGGAVVGGTLLAGCSGQSDSGSSDTPEPTETETATEKDDGSYTVEMIPVGELTFEKPPETAVTYWSTYGDMLVALGQGDALLATAWGPDSYPKYPYEEIPDLGFSPEDTGSLYADGGVSRELIYEMDPDILHFDPNIMKQWFGFDDNDLKEITENVGPFAANYIRKKGDKWHDYPYYSLYEAFEKVAQIYQQEERFEAFKQLHDDTISSIQSRLPSEDDRPSVALIVSGSEPKKGELTGVPVEDQVGKKQYHDLGINDGLAELETDGSFYQLDYEALLEADPEAIVVTAGMTMSEESFDKKFVQPMKDDAVGSEVAAVKNDRVFRGGHPNQGPIINLVNTEIAAHQLYPDVFGDEQLFDRQHVADIVDGDV